jgi:hypothetical protein
MIEGYARLKPSRYVRRSAEASRSIFKNVGKRKQMEREALAERE